MKPLRAYLASPTYGPVEPRCRNHLMVAVMTAANHGVSWQGDLSQDRMTFMDARNKAAEILHENPASADGIFWVDSDMFPEPDAIWRLANDVRDHDLDFVSGVYHQRRGQHRPVFFRYNYADDTFTMAQFYEPNKLSQEGGCGFGLCWTSTRLIEKIAALPTFDTDKGGWFPDHRHSGVSEDLGFSRNAIKAGSPCWVDTGIQAGHLGDGEIITREHHLRVLAPKGFTRVEQG